MRVDRRIILFFVAFLLGGYVLVYEINGSSKKDPTGPLERIFHFQADNVEEIEILRKSQNIFFKKEGAQWDVAHPDFADAVAPDIINKRIQNLLTIFDYGIVRVVVEGPSDISQFGLDKSELLLSIKVKGEAQPKILLIGNDNPTFMSCYAMVEGEQRVLLLGISYKAEIEREIDFFLDGHIRTELDQQFIGSGRSA